MKNTIKDFLGAALIITILVLAYSAFSYAGTYSKAVEPSSFRSFSVSANGEAVAVPDIAVFTFSVLTQGGKDIAVLQKENTDKMNAIIDFLKSSGIDTKDIKTMNYNVTPRYSYSNQVCDPVPMSAQGSLDYAIFPPTCRTLPPEIIGYEIRQSAQVKIRDMSKAGDIAGGVVDKGANTVSSLSFDIDDLDKVQSEAREDAIKKAKEKAKSIADAADFDIGRLLRISEGYDYYSGTLLKNAASDSYAVGGAISEAAPAPSIEPGSQEIVITVTLTYEIE